MFSQYKIMNATEKELKEWNNLNFISDSVYQKEINRRTDGN
jgi:hypothetical protein